MLDHGTDPLLIDTDGGGVNDGEEIDNGTNPLDPSDDQPSATSKKEEGGCSCSVGGGLGYGAWGWLVVLLAWRRRAS